jgi:hypothetical protein
MSFIYSVLCEMKSLCQVCYESNVTITLDEGTPKCAKCYEFGLFHKKV